MKKLAGKKILMVIAKSRFRDEEYLVPRKVLENEDAIITVASSSRDVATGMLGAKVKPDILLTDAREADYDGIVFVGGGGAAEYFDSPVAHKLARGFSSRGKLTAAICVAPATLANAGVLSGKKATSFPTSQPILTAKGAVFSPDSVVVDGNIVTAAGPEAAIRFGEALLKVLSS